MTATAGVTHHGTGALAGGDKPAGRNNPVVGLIQGFASDANSVLERQICTACVFYLAQLFLLVPTVDVEHLGVVLAAEVLMAAATGAACVLRSPHVPPRAAMFVPLAGILSVGLLRAGTGGLTSIFTIMMALPVISLGVEPGRLPMLLGGPVTVFALMIPLATDPTSLANGQWSRIVFSSAILGLVCLSANELTRRLRSRVRAVQRLRREQQDLLTTAQDNTEIAGVMAGLLRDSTDQLTSVINAVTEQSIIATDRLGRIDVFNTGAQKMLGVAPHDAIGRSILQFHVPAELTPTYPAPPPEIAGDDPFRVLVAGVRDGVPGAGDWTYVKPDGSEARVRIAVTARRDAAQEIDGFLFVATDVTDDREQARMKDEFVNLISHELRTPLSSILGYLELVSDDEDNPLSAVQNQYLATIERNANRLLRLVSDLLFTAQVESGRFQIQQQVVNLHTLLQASMDTAAPIAGARDILLRLSESNAPISVLGDPVRLGQAVDNLISNAIKFTPVGGRVAITLGFNDDDDHPRALICVSDTGVGIPAAELDRLFSRFFRASTATKNAIPGVGLGLTIAKAITVAHGGELRVASTVGEGTSFTLEVPLMGAEADLEVPASGAITQRVRALH